MADDKKARLDALAESATEADLDRHEMEAAVLATVAQHGLNAQELLEGFLAVSWSRRDFAGIAAALESTIMVDRIPVDELIIRRMLIAADVEVKAEDLTGILDGSKAKPVAVAETYVKKLEGQDRVRRAWDAGRDYLAAVEKAKPEGGDVDAAALDAAVGGLLKTAFDLAHKKRLVREADPEVVDTFGFLDTLTARRADGRPWLGLDCGFRHLNEVLNGLAEGLFILVGPPSCGKTALAKQIADHVAAVEKVPVLFWSFEQSKEELRIKSLARLAQVDSRAIWKGRSDADTWKEVEGAFDAYRLGPGWNLTIIEAGREDTLDRIRAAAVMAKHRAKDRPVLLILDYLQIIPAGKDAPDTLRERVDWHLSELRRLARDLKSPVLVISSENREGWKRNVRPTLAALKESGGIEYTADGVICLWWDQEESVRLSGPYGYNRPTARVEAHVLKNRNGELAKVNLDFTPAWSLFTERDRVPLDYDAALGE